MHLILLLFVYPALEALLALNVLYIILINVSNVPQDFTAIKVHAQFVQSLTVTHAMRMDA